MSIELKPVKELPKIAGRGVRRSEYDEILEKFLADEETKYAEVSKEGIKTVSLASALKARISKNKLTNKVKVRQIKGKVYLEKL